MFFHHFTSVALLAFSSLFVGTRTAMCLWVPGYQNHRHQNDESSGPAASHRGRPGLLFAVFRGGFMNRLRSAFFGLGLLLVATAAQAQQYGGKPDIRCDFVVGDQRLPAGEYTVLNQGPVGQAILIRSDENKTAMFSLTQPC